MHLLVHNWGNTFPMVDFDYVDVDPAYCLVRRAVCAKTDLSATIGRLFGEIISANPEAEMEGPPRIYYLAWGETDCEIEAAIPVAEGLPGGPIESKTYPAVRAIVAEHLGPYEELSKTWEDLWTQVEQQQLPADMPCWDSYVTDPDEEQDSSKWLTEIYIPLKNKAV